ncbi:MAG: sensor histidine kinase [Streptosporangiaceae bacterium]
MTPVLTHVAFPYDCDDHFLEAVVPFLLDGTELGDAVLAATSPDKLKLLREAVGDRVRLIDSAHWYDHPARIVSNVLRHLEDEAGAGRRLRLLSEPVWLGRTPLEILEWQRVEALVNLVFAGTDASIMCPYNVNALPVEILDGARRTHPATVHGRFHRDNPAYQDPAEFSLRCDREPLTPAPEDSAALPVSSPDMRDLRALISAHARRHGMTGGSLHHLLVAATEVATNALNHGQPPIELRLWPEGDQLVCEIADRGYWHPGTGPGPGLVPPREKSALGLWAVRMLCDMVQVRTGPAGTRVRIRTPICA